MVIAATDSVATHPIEMNLPNVYGEFAERGSVKWRLVVGKIDTSAGDGAYSAANEIGLDNLFNSATSSYIGLVASTCKALGFGLYVSGTNMYPVYFDWPNKKARVLKVDASASGGPEQPFTEVTNTTAIGDGTIEFAVIGQVA